MNFLPLNNCFLKSAVSCDEACSRLRLGGKIMFSWFKKGNFFSATFLPLICWTNSCIETSGNGDFFNNKECKSASLYFATNTRILFNFSWFKVYFFMPQMRKLYLIYLIYIINFD